MNDFEAWQKILKQWETVNRLKKLNQTLYDYLGSSLIYILEYAKQNDIVLPHRDRLHKMVDESERIIDDISDYCKKRKSIPDELLHRDNYNGSDEDDTEPNIERYIRIRTIVKLCLIQNEKCMFAFQKKRLAC